MECQCGCGNKTGIATRTITARGIRKGDHLSYLPGHAGGHATRREGITPDLWTVTDTGYETPCWIWNRARKNQWGHCSVWIGGKEFSAHRAVYEHYIGPIEAEFELDHLCKRPPCVRPSHLEPVTHAENIRRSPLAKLNHESVAFIRSSDLSAIQLASMFNVTRATIHNVRSGRTWA